MKEPHVEGVASHDGPESCGGVREDHIEALDRGMSGHGNLRCTRRLVAELAGSTKDWELARRLFAVGVRQLCNTLRA